MRITIQLRPGAAQAVHELLENPSSHKEENPEVSQLVKAIQKHGGKMEAVHPGASHPLLLPFFSAEVATTQLAQSLVRELKNVEIVESAFLAPSAQLP
jgi:hypothetical protein